MGKKIDLRRVGPIKRYKVSELAKKIGITRRAIYYMIERGLPVLEMPEKIIVGDEFRDFIKGEHERKKIAMKPDEMFCLTCRQAQPVGNQKVTINDFKNSNKDVNEGTIILSATCPKCKRQMNKISNQSQIELLRKIFNIE